jgi:hypothetical protein
MEQQNYINIEEQQTELDGEIEMNFVNPLEKPNSLNFDKPSGVPAKSSIIKKSANFAANKILTYTGFTGDKVAFHGKGLFWPFFFILWYLVVNGAFFGGMMYYYLYSSCQLTNQLVDLKINDDVSFFQDSFNSDGNFLCASYTTEEFDANVDPIFTANASVHYVTVNTFSKPCQLQSTSCSKDYGRWNKKQCKDKTGCEEKSHCEYALQTDNPHLSSPSVSVYYLNCYNASTAVANSFSYCTMAQIFVIGFFLLFRRLIKKGLKKTMEEIADAVNDFFSTKVHVEQEKEK